VWERPPFANRPKQFTAKLGFLVAMIWPHSFSKISSCQVISRVKTQRQSSSSSGSRETTSYDSAMSYFVSMICRLALAPKTEGEVEKSEISLRAHSTIGFGIGGTNPTSLSVPEGERAIVK
jgi:hypothetical protein